MFEYMIAYFTTSSDHYILWPERKLPENQIFICQVGQPKVMIYKALIVSNIDGDELQFLTRPPHRDVNFNGAVGDDPPAVDRATDH
jgi:hypothetical protein